MSVKSLVYCVSCFSEHQWQRRGRADLVERLARWAHASSGSHTPEAASANCPSVFTIGTVRTAAEIRLA